MLYLKYSVRTRSQALHISRPSSALVYWLLDELVPVFHVDVIQLHVIFMLNKSSYEAHPYHRDIVWFWYKLTQHLHGLDVVSASFMASKRIVEYCLSLSVLSHPRWGETLFPLAVYSSLPLGLLKRIRVETSLNTCHAEFIPGKINIYWHFL